MENALAHGETAGESKGAHQAPEKDNDLTAGGHELPRDWLLRIVLIWSGYAVSMFAAVMGAGLLAGALALMAANPQKKLAFIIVVAAFIVGAGAFVSGLIPPDGYWLFVACVGVLAIACAWFNAPLMTLLQKGIPEDKLGRVMGLFTAMNGLAIPIGTALGGAVAEITGTPMFFTIDGVLILAIGAGIALSKNVRQLD